MGNERGSRAILAVAKKNLRTESALAEGYLSVERNSSLVLNLAEPA